MPTASEDSEAVSGLCFSSCASFLGAEGIFSKFGLGVGSRVQGSRRGALISAPSHRLDRQHHRNDLQELRA